MSLGQRPTNKQERRDQNISALKKGVLKQNKRRSDEDEVSFSKRVQSTFARALGMMLRRERERFSLNPKPHQGYKERDRRVRQMERGAIWNYDRDTHYMQRGY